MKTVGVVTFLSLLVTLGTGRPGKHFLVETEANDTGNEVARFNARFNAPNVEEYEGKVRSKRVSITSPASLQRCPHPPFPMSSSLSCNKLEHYISQLKNVVTFYIWVNNASTSFFAHFYPINFIYTAYFAKKYFIFTSYMKYFCL